MHVDWLFKNFSENWTVSLWVHFPPLAHWNTLGNNVIPTLDDLIMADSIATYKVAIMIGDTYNLLLVIVL